jgi:hypothetical protein
MKIPSIQQQQQQQVKMQGRGWGASNREKNRESF